MTDRFDAVVIGAGPAGEVAVSRLAAAGLRVALCEQELIGGECAYWACIPSKTLLRPTEAQADARRTAGVSVPQIDWPEVAAYRDFMIRELDDASQETGYRELGVEVLRGPARITGPGRIAVGQAVVDTDRIVVATGSETRIPRIDGLQETGYWTNRDATTVKELPASIVILGGGPVGIELSQFFARVGTKVRLVQAPARLIDREDATVGALIADVLAADGVELRTGVRAVSARRESERVVVLDDGTEVRGQELLIATGRSPRVESLGLETIGIHPGPEGIQVDERCRAGEGVWAVGDVTGVMPFTHVGMYQARVASADIAGRPGRADYAAIPRVVFSDPEIAAVGLTAEQAAAKGNIDVTSSRVELADAIARPWTYQENPTGTLGLLADRDRQVLVGAWAVAPLAGEWIHQAALAIKAKIPLDVLRDTVAQFPTFSEAYLKAVEQLDA